MVNELEKIKEIEAELIKVRLEITEKEKEYEKLNKKINNLYIGLPLGIGSIVCGLLIVYAGWISLGIFFLISIIYSLFIMFGTEASKKVRYLYKNIKLRKKKKKNN
jgi:hypothetical protein